MKKYIQNKNDTFQYILSKKILSLTSSTYESFLNFKIEIEGKVAQVIPSKKIKL